MILRFIFLPWLWLTAVVWFIFSVMSNKYDSIHPPHPEITFKQWHHGYLGDIMFLVGLYFGGWGIWLQFSGLILRVDDTIQHYAQLTIPDFRSILHRLYVKYLWPIPIIQKINKWLDRLFGGHS